MYYGIEMMLLSTLLVLIVFGSSVGSMGEQNKLRTDPNYSEEFARVIDAQLAVLLVLDGYPPCDTVNEITESLHKHINASQVDVFKAHSSSSSSSSPFLNDCMQNIPILKEVRSTSSAHSGSYDILVSFSTSLVPSIPSHLGTKFRIHIYFPPDKDTTRGSKNSNWIKLHGYDSYMYYENEVNSFRSFKTFDEIRSDISIYNLHQVSAKKHTYARLPINLIKVPSTVEGSFVEQFTSVVTEGVLAKPFSDFVKLYLPLQQTKAIRKTGLKYNVAMIVEPREHPHLEFVVRNIMLHLNNRKADWRLQIHISSQNQGFVKRILLDIPDVQYRLLPDKFYGSTDYNTLLKGQKLWRDFHNNGIQNVLIFQVDSILIGNDISPYLKYDFIGAPWHITPSAPSADWVRNDYELLSHKQLYFEACCNGGLSLRNVAAMVNITKSRASRNPHVNEDTYFSSSAKDMGLKLPKRHESYSFALEIPCHDISTKSSRSHLGLHNAWMYLSLVEIKRFFEESMNSIQL